MIFLLKSRQESFLERKGETWWRGAERIVEINGLESTCTHVLLGPGRQRAGGPGLASAASPAAGTWVQCPTQSKASMRGLKRSSMERTPT